MSIWVRGWKWASMSFLAAALAASGAIASTSADGTAAPEVAAALSSQDPVYVVVPADPPAPPVFSQLPEFDVAAPQIEHAKAPLIVEAPAAADAPLMVEAFARPPLSPLSAALRAAAAVSVTAIRANPGQTPAASWRREREALAAFYASRDFEPLWLRDGAWTPAARSALRRLERARDDGLDVSQYLISALPEGDPEVLAGAELQLSHAIVGYARQASGGRIDPRSISVLITARPEVADPAFVLTSVSSSPSAGDALRAFNPPHAQYRALREKLEEVRREKPPIVARASIEPGPVLKIGMKDPRVPLIRARFGIDANEDATDNGLVYDTRVAGRVAEFQRANGLPASGALTARTISALSGGEPAQLEGEIVANMERWRWLPRDLGATRVEVNIPDFQVKVTKDEQVVHRARVIVGKAETQTPIFSDAMEYLVVNPYWNVPPSIIRKEMLPAYQKDPAYFTKRGYEVVQRGGNVSVRQPPGERNALGQIKFIFPNDHSVYLHDTPSRGLFANARRAYSHGCVRVDKPFALAEVLLPAEWSEQRLRKLVGSGEKTVRLASHIPVHLQYFTVFTDEAGQLQVRDDIYGHSRKVRTALGL
jgi:murein L,D-transpeptidase YcbB/YkuD